MAEKKNDKMSVAEVFAEIFAETLSATQAKDVSRLNDVRKNIVSLAEAVGTLRKTFDENLDKAHEFKVLTEVQRIRAKKGEKDTSSNGNPFANLGL